MRTKQTLAHVKRVREKYGKLELRMTVWEALDSLSGFVDVSDPDVNLPNLVHLYQTAEGMREANLPDWLQLIGLLHDMGKVIFKRGCDEDGTSSAKQFSVVGDTFITGCALPDSLIFPEFNLENLDASDPSLTTKLGIYQPGCGLDNTYVAYGHDEYLYQVLRQNAGVKLPDEALYIIRYHSLYPWHDQGAYAELESDLDRQMKGWVKIFNQHDLYTKKNVEFTDEKMAEMRSYYDGLISKYLPETLLF
jgi:inositol oxygenase